MHVLIRYYLNKISQLCTVCVTNVSKIGTKRERKSERHKVRKSYKERQIKGNRVRKRDGEWQEERKKQERMKVIERSNDWQIQPESINEKENRKSVRQIKNDRERERERVIDRKLSTQLH